MKGFLRSKLFLTMTAFVLLAGAITIPLSGSIIHSHAQDTVTINEFPIPTTSASPEGITSGPDGNLWFTEGGGNKIGQITPSGTITEYPIPTASSGPWGITSGPDGNLWFTEYSGSTNKIGKITSGGSITEFTLPSGGNPTEITSGPDGNLWFTEYFGNRIGRITPSGIITEFPLSNGGNPSGITSGPDGNLWFTEWQGNKIGRITPNGTPITEYPIPTGSSNPNGITSRSDGNLWFTEASGEKIGQITPSGAITEFTLPVGGGDPFSITSGPDGNLWFAERSPNLIGQITSSGIITQYSIPTPSSLPWDITSGPDGKLWFTENSGNKIGRISLPSPTPTPSPTLSPTPKTIYFSNYAGYASGGSQTQPVTYTDVKGSWTVPAAQNCTFPKQSESAFWVGLGGFPNGKAIEQIATESNCTRSGLPLYRAVYEMFPAGPQPLDRDPNKYPVNAGNNIQAEVHYIGNNMFTLTMTNGTQWKFSKTLRQTQMVGALNSAECITEAAAGPLTNFGTVDFSNCNANGNPISSGPIVYQSVMVISKSNNTPRALPSNLKNNGTAFSVQWKHS